MNKQITVLGDGAMATACAMILASKDNSVTMWSLFPDTIKEMTLKYENVKYLPGIPLPRTLSFTTDEEIALKNTQLIVAAIPTQFIRSVFQQLVQHIPPNTPIISVAKGIENDTLMCPTQIITDVLTKPGPLAALSGPSIAKELARCLPATVCVAGPDENFIQQLQQLFTTSHLRVYTNSDLPGVELAGATKNVIAIAAGILDGLHAGYNAKSALLSRGLVEIARLGNAMGANNETFFGITGVGDLATTCFCPEGRNRSAGELLGKGIKLNDVLKQIQGIVEGIPTTRSVMALSKIHNVEMPITAAVHAVLFEHLDPIKGISQLMNRQPKKEQIG